MVEDARVITAGKFHQFGDFTHFVAGVVARPEARATDVHGVGAVQDGFTGDGHVTGGAEQFQVMLGQGHSFFSQAVTVKARIVAAKRPSGTLALPSGKCPDSTKPHIPCDNRLASAYGLSIAGSVELVRIFVFRKTLIRFFRMACGVCRTIGFRMRGHRVESALLFTGKSGCVHEAPRKESLSEDSVHSRCRSGAAFSHFTIAQR